MGDKKFATIYENVYGSKISWYVYKPLQQKFTEYFPLGIVSYDNEPWELDFIQRTILHTQPKPWCMFDIRPAIFIWHYKQHLNKK